MSQQSVISQPTTLKLNHYLVYFIAVSSVVGVVFLIKHGRLFNLSSQRTKLCVWFSDYESPIL